MTQAKDNGGPAYPGKSFTQCGHQNGYSMGMTLRDYFAALAPAMPEWFVPPSSIGPKPSGTIFPYDGPRVEFGELLKMDIVEQVKLVSWRSAHFAALAYTYADAMLEARK